jgi:scyllo-inositol 2-dehydrogenase (NADP+)
MSRVIKVGIIGQGRSGYYIHSATIKNLPEMFKIVAVSDQDEKFRARAEEEFECVSYADYSELLEHEGLDLVVNASPSHLHVPLTLQCLERGLNVLCEKPLARTKEEVDLLIAAAAKSGARLTTFQQSRFAPAFQQIMKVIGSGVMGRVIQARIAFNGFQRRWDWQTLQSNNGGNLLNTGPHPLDQALQIFGPDTMPEIVCHMDRVNTFGDAEDYVKMILKKPGHPLIDLEISSCDEYPLGTYHIQCQNGTISGSHDNLVYKYFDPKKAPKQELVRTPLLGADGNSTYCNETLPWVEESWEPSAEQKELGGQYPYQTYYRQLYHSLVNDAPMVVTAEHVRMQIAVIEECHRQNPLTKLESQI